MSVAGVRVVEFGTNKTCCTTCFKPGMKQGRRDERIIMVRMATTMICTKSTDTWLNGDGRCGQKVATCMLW